MFGMRELKERVAKLEEELGKKTKALESAMDYQDEVAEFLLKYNKNDIVLDRIWKAKNHALINQHIIKYAYNGKFKVANLESVCDILTLRGVEEINSFTTIIEIEEMWVAGDKVAYQNHYYQLDKIANTLTDITETRKALLKETEKKTSTTKSQNKKENK